MIALGNDFNQQENVLHFVIHDQPNLGNFSSYSACQKITNLFGIRFIMLKTACYWYLYWSSEVEHIRITVLIHTHTHTHTHKQQNKYTSATHFEMGYNSIISSKVTTITYGYWVEEG